MRAVIFDVDGTLVQTERLKWRPAGINVVAIVAPFSAVRLHLSEIVDDVWIVHRPEEVAEIVRHRIAEHDRSAHDEPASKRQGGQ